MNEKNSKLLKEGINNIIDKVLDEDLDNGHKLLQLCNGYEEIKINTNINNCEINNHQKKVLLFINNINLRYSILINVYNVLNGSVSSNNNATICSSLQIYVDFLEKVKKLKNGYDKGKSGNELIKILKGGNNE